jgi:hypothetical protein
MTTKTESLKIGDFLRFEEEFGFSRKTVTIGHSQTLVAGQLVQDDPSNPGEYMALAAAVNEVQTITFGAAMTAGTLILGIKSKDGEWLDFTQAWSTDWAGTMAAFNTKFDTALGTGAVVMTGTATVPVLTFSGTNYAGKPQEFVKINASAATGVTTVALARTTAGTIAGGAVAGIMLYPVTTGVHPDTKTTPIVYRDAILFKGNITYGTNVDTTPKKAAVDALLEAMRIRISASTTYTTG